MTKDRYQLLTLDDRLLSIESLTPADVGLIRSYQEENKILCPTCSEPMQLIISQSGPELDHRPGSIYYRHDPDDRRSLALKQLLARHLADILPGPDTPGANQAWRVAVNVPIHEARLAADVLAVSDRGARFVVEFQGYDLGRAAVIEKTDQWIAAAIHPLWLLDGRRLRALKEKVVQNITLAELETTLLALDMPLIYLLSDQATVVSVVPTPETKDLIKLGDKRLGQTPCLIRRYPLSQLGLKDGSWFLPTRYNDKPPPAPALTKSQANRLRRLRDGARSKKTR